MIVNLSGWGGGRGDEISGGGVVKKRESPDFRSPEVGISVIMLKSREGTHLKR